MGVTTFSDRREAGRVLAADLRDLAGGDTVVLGLARGGVPVAAEVADALDAALDVFVVRKLGVPGHEELAMGAVATGGVTVRNEQVLAAVRVSPDTFEAVRAREQSELLRRERLYRGDRPPLSLEERTVVLVDDGIATGSSMRAALDAVRQQQPARLVVAVPVGPTDIDERLSEGVDRVVCARTPRDFVAVGAHYDEFLPTSDDEVRALVSRATARPRQ